ncbi:MAG TPA: sugar phosphate nucleotidyltransferase, partial [Bacteroidales bacterium]|nr:sugar phosphate nucleotidyltransferase [Bacteroidales bacterium]
MKKKAMILAAGLGTRMRPLTDNTPKALLTWKNKTLLEGVIERLLQHGFKDIIINVHHHADQVLRYLE